MPTAYTLEPATAQDFEALLALRMRAMRESLERLGRYDEQRARARLAAGFNPAQTQHVVVDGERVGFVVLRPGAELFLFDDLYLEPKAQNQGIGHQVMQWACAQADAVHKPMQLMALKQSDANRFYQRHGFVVVGESQWDVHYRRPPRLPNVLVVRQFWAEIQLRDWIAARALLRADFQAQWWTSGERFESAAAYIEVQERYPEGWVIHVLECQQLDDGRVHSLLRIDHDPTSFFATVFCTVQEGLITRSEEYWATAEEPPAWRTQAQMPGHSRIDARADPRAVVATKTAP